MASTWGNHLKLSLFGESHGPAIGLVLDNLPPGETVDMAAVRKQNTRRRPGQADWTTPREETDQAEILSGVYEGHTTGSPLALVIYNRGQHSRDYRQLENTPRPGHADLSALIRYNGANDPRGSGHFSGRLTAPLVAAGTICRGILARRGVYIGAHAQRIGSIADISLDAAAEDYADLMRVQDKAFPTLDDALGAKMREEIILAKDERDSIGGVVEVAAYGFPPGIGDPFFGGIEPRLAAWFFALPAVKGVSFGAGFAVAERRGSENNDAPEIREDGARRRIRMRSNHAGGADGGISTGMPIIARLAFKPPASIGKTQPTIDLVALKNTTLEVEGRHDPCIVPRAVPVVEAVMAIALLDLLLDSGCFNELAPREKSGEPQATDKG